eukprot:GILK01010725.1.p1 GENE.GILK01010725.1~~GILK01010725.1.p1  ORF type:complete len:531 (+),score=89.24 GILK01010725.1:33-1625(+)
MLVPQWLSLLSDKRNAFFNSRNPHKFKLWQTSVYCVSYISMGLLVGCTGPTLLLLVENVNEPLEISSSYFLVRGGGWLFGSILSGKLYETHDGHKIFFAVSLIVTLCMWLLPLIHVLFLSLLVTAVMAASLSFIDVGANCMLFAVWGDKVAPYMQFLHFCFGIGATISPAVVSAVIRLSSSGSELLWSYFVLGALMLLTAALPAFVPGPPTPAPLKAPKTATSTSKRTVKQPKEAKAYQQLGAVDDTEDTEVEEEEQGAEDVQSTEATASSDDAASPDGDVEALVGKWRYRGLVSIVALYLFLYVGMEVSYGSWVASFATLAYNVPIETAALFSSDFWIFITAGRLLAVFLSAKFKGRTLLVMDLCGSTLAVILLLAFVESRNEPMLWLSTALFGFSLASVYATVFSLPADMGVKITSRASSIFIVGTSIGDMLLPALVGVIFVQFGALPFLVTIFLLNACLVGLYFVMISILVKFGTHLKSVQDAVKSNNPEVAAAVEDEETGLLGEEMLTKQNLNSPKSSLVTVEVKT